MEFPSDIKITFLRHAEAQVSALEDELRPLSYRGLLQAEDRAVSFMQQEPFDLVITSSATRTIQTAHKIAESLAYTPTMVTVAELYLPPNVDDREKVVEMLEQLGAASLEEYLKADSGSWNNYTRKALEALLHCIMQCAAKNVLVVAHGNIINSIGLMLSPNEKTLLSKYFGGAEGFTWNSSNRSIFYS